MHAGCCWGWSSYHGKFHSQAKCAKSHAHWTWAGWNNHIIKIYLIVFFWAIHLYPSLPPAQCARIFSPSPPSALERTRTLFHFSIVQTIVSGFAGATADAMTLRERLERKLEEYPGELVSSCNRAGEGCTVSDRSAQIGGSSLGLAISFTHAIINRHQIRMATGPTNGTPTQHTTGQLKRSCVELAKQWRTDKYLRQLDAVSDGRHYTTERNSHVYSYV